jgi:predicted nucleic acid-binding protein
VPAHKLCAVLDTSVLVAGILQPAGPSGQVLRAFRQGRGTSRNCWATPSVATTQIYRHVSIGHLKEMLKRCHPRERDNVEAKDKDDDPDSRRDS